MTNRKIFKNWMKCLLLVLVIVVLLIMAMFWIKNNTDKNRGALSSKAEKSYWFILHRKSNKENLYLGEAGKKENSKLVKTFLVKTGIPGERPTPLPWLLGKKYWLIINKRTTDNPETAPYFLTLDILYSKDEPYGPVPYLECSVFGETKSANDETKLDSKKKQQCNWVLPGEFGLHGVNGDNSKLSAEDPGSSGCIRHKDEDIKYLYKILNPEKEAVRYYIEDN